VPTRSADVPAWLAAVLGPAGIVALGCLLYANSFSIPFLFDDYLEIQVNPTVKQLQPLPSYLTRLRGLTALTFALNVRQGGYEVWGFHLVNVALHLVNALLVCALVLWTLRLPCFAGRYATRARWLATLVALVFVAHPLQTMVASYLVQRAEGLGAFFYLTTLLCAVFAFAAHGGRRVVLLGGAALAAVLGIVSKEIVATVPVAVALYWFCFLRGAGGGAAPSWRRRLLLLALLALPVAYGLVLARAYLFPGAAPGPEAGPRSWMFIPTAGFRVEGIGPWQYLITQFGVIAWYLRLFLVPVGQVFDYGWPFADSVWRADVLVPLACLLALVAAAVLAYHRYRLATFCIAWVFVTLAPTSSIIPLKDAAFEHRMYLPVAGLAWLLVVGGSDLLAALAARVGQAPRAAWRAGALALGAWIALLGLATVHRNAVYADPFRFAEDNAAKAPGHWRAQYHLGEVLTQRGRQDEATAAYEAAVRLNPDQGSARIALGGVYLAQQRYEDAERVLEPATRLMEESVVAAASLNIAVAHQGRGDLPRAEAALQRTLQLRPKWSAAQRQLAALYARQQRFVPAAKLYDDALRTTPRLRDQLAAPAAIANFRGGVQLTGEDERPAARRLFERALELDPQLWRARGYLAYLAARDGDWPRARAEMERLGREQSGDPWVAESQPRVQDGLPIVPPPPG
jgi:tetratricopeptide (TPR) repeat protein